MILQPNFPPCFLPISPHNCHTSPTHTSCIFPILFPCPFFSYDVLSLFPSSFSHFPPHVSWPYSSHVSHSLPVTFPALCPLMLSSNTVTLTFPASLNSRQTGVQTVLCFFTCTEQSCNTALMNLLSIKSHLNMYLILETLACPALLRPERHRASHRPPQDAPERCWEWQPRPAGALAAGKPAGSGERHHLLGATVSAAILCVARAPSERTPL